MSSQIQAVTLPIIIITSGDLDCPPWVLFDPEWPLDDDYEEDHIHFDDVALPLSESPTLYGPPNDNLNADFSLTGKTCNVTYISHPTEDTPMVTVSVNCTVHGYYSFRVHVNCAGCQEECSFCDGVIGYEPGVVCTLRNNESSTPNSNMTLRCRVFGEYKFIMGSEELPCRILVWNVVVHLKL
jgi:hypothetical protein